MDQVFGTTLFTEPKPSAQPVKRSKFALFFEQYKSYIVVVATLFVCACVYFLYQDPSRPFLSPVPAAQQANYELVQELEQQNRELRNELSRVPRFAGGLPHPAALQGAPPPHNPMTPTPPGYLSGMQAPPMQSMVTTMPGYGGLAAPNTGLPNHNPMGQQTPPILPQTMPSEIPGLSGYTPLHQL